MSPWGAGLDVLGDAVSVLGLSLEDVERMATYFLV
jgi:hypothetical protein